jgi:hypothetical protein
MNQNIFRWLHERVWQPLTSQGATPIATVVIAIVTAVYVFFAGEQWSVMRGQLKQMRYQAGQNERVVGLMRDQLDEMKASSAQADRSIAALNRQADMLSESVRAWVAPSFMQHLSDGTPAMTQIRLNNAGRAPALKVTWSEINLVLVDYIPETNAAHPQTPIRNSTCDGLNPSSDLVLWPNTPTNFWLPLRLDTTPVDSNKLQAARLRLGSLVVQGCIAYLTAKGRHTSEFQFLWRDTAGQPPGQWNFNLTPDGNDAN